MIVLTAPTGDIGHQVLDRLLDSGEPLRVIARDPSRLPAHVRARVEIVQGSHGDAAVVDAAFAGAGAVFWLVPPNPQGTDVRASYVDFTRPACEAITRHGVQRVVAVSALGRGTPLAADAGYVTASLAMDDEIASTGVDLRVLTMPSFMDNLLRQIEPIKRQGVFFSPLSGDRKAPTCATRDVAAVAAQLLLDATWTGQAEVPVLGPEDLSGEDMAQTMAEVLGRPVRFQQVPGEALREQLTGRGMSEAMADGMLAMMVAKENGLDNFEPRTPQATTPTTFRQWCEDTLKPAAEALDERNP